MSVNIFKVTNVGGIQLVKTEMLLTPAFEDLYNKYEGDEGMLKKVWRYIYEFSNQDSMSNMLDLTNEETHIEAVKAAGLPHGWKTNATVTKAATVYEEQSYNPAKETRNVLLSIFELYPLALKKIKNRLKDIIGNTTAEANTAGKKKTADQIVDETMAKLERANAIAAKYPELVVSLYEALKIINKVEGEDVARGGDKIKKSMEVER